MNFKKIAVITGITIGIFIGGTIVVVQIMNNTYTYKQKQEALASGMTEGEYSASVNEKEAWRYNTKRVGFGGGETKVNLNENADEFEVISVMHKMTHQKIRSTDKWGAIEMTPENVQKVKTIIEANDYKFEKELMTIIQNWEQNDFSNAAQHHNLLWKKQDGTIGKAYDNMTPEEEKAFIENNFR